MTPLIVERLRARETTASKYGGFALINPDGPEAADLIQSLSDRIDVLEGENADLIHDLERQMTIANIECNEAEKAKETLRQCARLARMETSSLATAIVETVNASLTQGGKNG